MTVNKSELLQSRYGEYIKNAIRALDDAYERGDTDDIKLCRIKFDAIRESLLYMLGEEYYFSRTSISYMIFSLNVFGETQPLIYVTREVDAT